MRDAYCVLAIYDIHDEREIVASCSCQLESNVRSALLKFLIEIEYSVIDILVALA